MLPFNPPIPQRGGAANEAERGLRQPSRIPLLLLALASLALLQAADAPKTTFSVQLVRGSDSDRPNDPAWKPVGASLSKSLQAVFRWKNYWEVNRQTVTLSKDKVARLRLSRESDVEVRLLNPPHTQIRLYHNGALTRCSHQPISEHMSVLGGESMNGECWFVVVRRDHPSGKN